MRLDNDPLRHESKFEGLPNGEELPVRDVLDVLKLTSPELLLPGV
jgi:hypothetical protein